ncbi:hypothetical protein HK102_001720 [Quaeritorhiza haematococci]|nr:hypothetical protein HK102_001720 [Quaeritorhiza haematococci]
MKAIVQNSAGDVNVLELKDVPKPTPQPHDLLVKVKAAAFNPVDTLKRKQDPAHPNFILGWDASGVVEAVGSAVTHFKVGDEVIFAGSLLRDGTYAEYTVVDERIVGPKPKKFDDGQSAGLPLVSLTAWEALIEQAGLSIPDGANNPNKDKSLIIINGAGGVGSVAIQLARHVLKLKSVIATASRPETIEWCKKLGATHVINHHNDLKQELEKIGIKEVDIVFLCFKGNEYISKSVELVKPFGKIVSICPLQEPLDLHGAGFGKVVTFSWAFMFAKAIHGVNMESQGKILAEIARLVDAGVLQNVVVKSGPFSLEAIKEAHLELDGAKGYGKTVVTF